MSYDLMVFELAAAPKTRKEFIVWYEQQIQWAEDHDYQTPKVTSNALQNWFQEMIQFFPPMNGPNASTNSDDSKVTDHCIGKHVIYSAFAWSEADAAHLKMRELAIKHKVGFYDVSELNGEILFPGQEEIIIDKKSWWKFW
jgi:hypothetical protein